jgi:polygalacturonase
MIDRRGFIGGSLALGGCASLPQRADVPDDWALADSIAAGIKRPRIDPATALITAHGAKSGFQHDALPAIRAAMASLGSGGGTVILPAGEWRSDGPIHLRSGVGLHIESGATLRFSREPRHYLPLVLTRWEGTEVWNYSPLFYAAGASDIAITGGGTIDGQGFEGFFQWRPKQKTDQNALRKMGADGVPVRDRVFGDGHYLRPGFVQFMSCSRVLVGGPRFVDSTFWMIHPVYCDHVTVRNITLVSKHLNSDGVDPDSSTNVLIERCTFDVSDDCVAVKSGRDADGWRVARPSSRIVVRDCIMNTDIAAAFAIGSEMSGGAHDIFVERLKVPHAEHALYFKANLDRGGVIERIRMRDIDVAKSETLIHFTTDYHSYRGGNAPPTYRDFTVQNVTCAMTEQALHIVGVPSAPVQDVRLRNIRVAKASKPDAIAHSERLTFEAVNINGTDVSVPS